MSLTWQLVNPEQFQHQREPIIAMYADVPPPERPQYVGVNVSTYYLNLKTMLDLKFESMMSVANNVNVTFFMLEVAGYTNYVLVKELHKNEIHLERQGVACRIGVASWGIEFRAAFTLSAVAANAQLSNSQTTIEVVVEGLGLEGLPFLEPLTKMTGGSFNVESLKQISETATSLAEYFATHGSTLTSKPLAVASISGSDYTPANFFYSGHFAVESIYRGRSLNVALALAAKQGGSPQMRVVPSYVRAVYKELGVDTNITIPDPDVRKKAEQILTKGRF